MIENGVNDDNYDTYDNNSDSNMVEEGVMMVVIG